MATGPRAQALATMTETASWICLFPDISTGTWPLSRRRQDCREPVFAVCQFRGVSVMCGPRGLKGEPDRLFHNNGDGTFTDVSEKAGVADPDRHYGFTSTFVDVNNDGKVDSARRQRLHCKFYIYQQGRRDI